MEEEQSLSFDLSLGKQLKASTVHRLPCKIHYDGNAAVEEMFTFEPLEQQSGERKQYVSTFRGRKLIAEETKVPEGVQGVVVGKKGDVFQVESRFDSAYCWNHDLIPSEKDEMPGWVQWINLSRSLHEAI